LAMTVGGPGCPGEARQPAAPASAGRDFVGMSAVRVISLLGPYHVLALRAEECLGIAGQAFVAEVGIARDKRREIKSRCQSVLVHHPDVAAAVGALEEENAPDPDAAVKATAHQKLGPRDRLNERSRGRVVFIDMLRAVEADVENAIYSLRKVDRNPVIEERPAAVPSRLGYAKHGNKGEHHVLAGVERNLDHRTAETATARACPDHVPILIVSKCPEATRNVVRVEDI